MLCFSPLGRAQTYRTWTQTAATKSSVGITTAGNWNPNGVPSALDNLVFSQSDTSSAKYILNNSVNLTNSFIFTNTDGYMIDVNNGTVSNKLYLPAAGIYQDASCTNLGVPSQKGSQGQNRVCLYIELTANSSILNDSTNETLYLRNSNNYTNTPAFTLGLDNRGFDLTVGGAGAIQFAGPATYTGGAIGGSGKLIKTGTGTVSLNATNTYTGTTLVRQGQLAIQTIHAGGGSFAVADNGGTSTTNASLSISLGASGQSLKISSLSLTNTTGVLNTNTLLIALSAMANVLPSVPVIYATNLTVVSNVYITITGSGYVPGIIPLIQYNNYIGGGTLITNSITSGVGAYLTNNTTAQQIQLVVQTVPSFLWAGKTNSTLAGQWDINGTSNWLNTANSPATPSFFQNGLSVQFNDTGLTNLVTLVTNVTPSVVLVTNNSLAYTFTNSGPVSTNGIVGSASLIKTGTGVLVLAMSNSFSGTTLVNGGILQAGAPNALSSSSHLTNSATLDLAGINQTVLSLNGTGVVTNSATTPVTLTILGVNNSSSGNINGPINENGSGSITLNKGLGMTTFSSGATGNYSGGTHVNAGNSNNRGIIIAGNNVLGTGPLYDEITGDTTLTADGSARTITNAIAMNYAFSFGSSGAGQLTLSGPVSLSGGGFTSFIINNDTNPVIFSGPITTPAGYFEYKTGPGTMTLKNSDFNQNTIPGVPADLPQIQRGGLVLDNSAVNFNGNNGNVTVDCQYGSSTASLMITNNASLTVANYLKLCNSGSPASSTNVVIVQNGTLNAGGIIMGSGSINSCQAVLKLLDGSILNVGKISNTTNGVVGTQIVLDGATINPIDNATSDFLSGMTNVMLNAGGVKLNGANTNTIHIAQNLNGSGGLRWSGTNGGDLTLDGVNTYTGDTVVQNGTLGGVGTLAGNLVLAKGTSLKIGEGADNQIGTFTVNGSATMTNNISCVLYLNTTNTPATNSYLVVTGSLAITNGNLVVNNNGPDLTVGAKFKLFSKAVAAGAFTNVALPAITDAGLAWQNNLAVDGSIQVISAVVSSPALGVSQSGSQLTFSWTGSFKLQSQTNTLSSGLGTNWLDYPGGSTSPVSVTINPANPAVFFRLSQ